MHRTTNLTTKIALGILGALHRAPSPLKSHPSDEILFDQTEEETMWLGFKGCWVSREVPQRHLRFRTGHCISW